MKVMNEKNIYPWSAKYYDFLINKEVIELDINFYKKLLGKNSTVLDIGCGTGRVALRLYKSCKEITCIDISETMLEIFRDKLKTQNIRNIEIMKSDMLDFKFKKSFDLIILPFRVFQVLTSKTQKVKFLKNAVKHMSDNSLLIIQMFDPNERIFKAFKTMNKLDVEFYDQENDIHIRRYTIGVSHQPKRQVVKSKYKFQILKNKKIIEEVEEPLELGYLYKNQADDLFRSVGLKIKEIYNDFNFTKYSDNEKRELIYVLQKCDVST